jgi:hypothetical protein
MDQKHEKIEGCMKRKWSISEITTNQKLDAGIEIDFFHKRTGLFTNFAISKDIMVPVPGVMGCIQGFNPHNENGFPRISWYLPGVRGIGVHCTTI